MKKTLKNKQIGCFSGWFIIGQRRFHFIVFNLFLLDGVFYGCRTLLHTKVTLETVFLKLLCLLSMLLLAVDLIVMGSTLLGLLGLDLKKEE